ncbi:plant UBX domain-containing protein 7 isoform X3 [Prunus dulcis]|uniref:plant UBX domain-containing protein 7 isoform X3 n=1 Tax=Prunus dulcis TaxID=3755 RepID=UPI0014827C2E|nr:plant UBX domain-containing protein 7 isoform X3 [Prunus dulcis]
MDGVISANDQQGLVTSFLEIAVGQTADTARQFLQATGWQLEEAIQLFYVGNEAGSIAAAQPPTENIENLADQTSGANENVVHHGINENVGQLGEDEVRPPMPVIRDVLYDDAALYGSPRARFSQHESGSVIAFRNFEEEMKHPGVWESGQGATSSAETARDNLASLYRPPFKLLFQGSFEKAKGAASVQDKWLLVNLQSTKEFSSHMLNRDTWANEAVSQTIITNFVFWQTYDDTTEGRKVCTYYKLESMPVVLIIDPITGQRMRSWNGMVQPECLLELQTKLMKRTRKCSAHWQLRWKACRRQVGYPKIKMKSLLTRRKKNAQPRRLHIHLCLKNPRVIRTSFAGLESVFQTGAGCSGISFALIQFRCCGHSAIPNSRKLRQGGFG